MIQPIYVATATAVLCGFLLIQQATSWTVVTLRTKTRSSGKSSSSSSSLLRTKYYDYFAYGSNVLPETMECVRNIRNYQNATAAVLPNYRLVFRGAASVEKCPGSVVHGVLYRLNEYEFDILSRTEGVMVTAVGIMGVYQWQDCLVVPYTGDSNCAGETALNIAQTMPKTTTIATKNNHGTLSSDVVGVVVSAKTLVFPKFPLLFPKYLPPSRSYLKIIQDGAKFWEMDLSYQMFLSKIFTTFIHNGLEGKLLQVAKLLNPPSVMRKR